MTDKPKVKCEAITQGGLRCWRNATTGRFCRQHAPERRDKFAAEWAQIPGRHKGKRMGHIWFSGDDVSGDATLSYDFLALDPIARADVLQDVIGVLQQEYEYAVSGIFPKAKDS